MIGHGTGAIVGFLSGLFGNGGSAITTPALQIFAGIALWLSGLPYYDFTTTLYASLSYRGRGG